MIDIGSWRYIFVGYDCFALVIVIEYYLNNCFKGGIRYGKQNGTVISGG